MILEIPGGMADDEMDDRCWSLWPLNKVIAENAHHKRPEILFADFLINSHFYCFRCENDSTSSVCIDYFDGNEPEKLTDSVIEFFELLVRDSGSLQMFGD